MAFTDSKAFVFDMDGVLWRGNTPMPALADLFVTLKRRAIPFMLATNNAMKTPQDYVQKLASFGVEVKAEQVLTSSVTAAAYIRQHYQTNEVYVVGEAGLQQAIHAEGLSILGPEAVRQGQRAAVVVAGLTQASLNYELLAMAAIVLQEGADFIATNADLSLPTEMGFFPGAGAILAMLSATTSKEPLVIGKPQPAMFEAALTRLNLAASEVTMVGDRLNTDIEGAKAVGMNTLMVLSGVSSREEAEQYHAKPDEIIRDIAVLDEMLAQG